MSESLALLSRAAVPPRHEIEENAASYARRLLIGPFSEVGPGEWETTPHRHGFVELMLVTRGSGRHFIDADEHPVRPGDLHVVAQGQLHHWHAGDDPIEGTLVLFREEFLTGPGGPGQRAWVGGVRRPDAPAGRMLAGLVDSLAQEVARPGPDHELLLRSLLTSLLVVADRLPGTEHASVPKPGLAQRLELMARATPNIALTVAECARRLSVTPGYLSDAVAASTGRSPSAILREAVVLEAQRLLARTDLACAQIAGLLGFEDPSYFSRFFRRETGRTPSGFRAAAGAHR